MSSTLIVNRNNPQPLISHKQELHPSTSSCSKEMIARVSAIFAAFISIVSLITLKASAISFFAVTAIGGGVVTVISLIALAVMQKNSSTQTPPKKASETKKEKTPEKIETPKNQNKTVSTSTTDKKVDPQPATPKVEETPKITPKVTVPLDPLAPRPVSIMVDQFDSCWDPKVHLYDELKPAMAFNEERFNRVLETFTKQFANKIDYSKKFGFIEKRDLPPSKIYVRADLHGDLKSLVENLKQLKTQNLLDENFHCKKDVHLVLLGDYMDRGPHSLEVAELLACLKMENPDQVHLIRGNHEHTRENGDKPGDKYGNFLLKINKQGDYENLNRLQKFYETMPLCLYLSQADEKHAGEKQYVQFTHGTFELTADPSEILDSPASIKTMEVSRNLQLSNRVSRLCINPAPQKLVDDAKSNYVDTRTTALKNIKEHYDKEISDLNELVRKLKNLVVADKTVEELKLKGSTTSESTQANDASSYAYEDLNIFQTAYTEKIKKEVVALATKEKQCEVRLAELKNEAQANKVKQMTLRDSIENTKKEIEDLQKKDKEHHAGVIHRLETKLKELLAEDVKIDNFEIEYNNLKEITDRKNHLATRLLGLKDTLKGSHLKQLECEISALHVRSIVECNPHNRVEDYTYYNWGDVNEARGFDKRLLGFAVLSPEDVSHYLNISSIHHKVMLLFRGHEHKFLQHKFDNRVLITTLPIGMDSNKRYREKYGVQADRAYILTTAPTVDKWTKQAFLRESGESETKITQAHPIISDLI